MTLRIRHAVPEDLPVLLEVVRALSAHHGDEARVTSERLHEIFFGSRSFSTALIAEMDGSPVGYAGISESVAIYTGLTRLDMHHLFVVESHRAAGVGKALIAEGKRIATKRGALGFIIGTDPRNTGAQNAYRAMGLEEITDAGPRFWIPVTE